MEELKIEFSEEEFKRFTEGFKMNLEIELEQSVHNNLLEVYGIENKRVYNINGKDCVMTDSEFDKFWEELVSKGYAIKSIVMDFPASSEDFSESQTIVGNKVKWGENNDN